MRIAYITAGAAGRYCGACKRDVGLTRALIERGHNMLLLPLYTPLQTDEPDPSLDRVFFGALNVYLQQQCSIFRRTPRSVDWLLDRPSLLRFVSGLGVETEAEELGEMTVSVLRGSEGMQRKELDKLLDFLEDEGPFDVVNLSNSLFSGFAAPIGERLGAPVVCNLQGEEGFVRHLPEEYREEAHELLRRHASEITVFVASYEAYADEMADFLDVPREKVKIVRPGLETSRYAGDRELDPEVFRVGYLSSINPRKGIDLLFDAFARLVEEHVGDAGPREDLAVGGQLLKSNEEFWEGLKADLGEKELGERLDYAGEMEMAEKVHFLKRCDVFCVPGRSAERNGMAWIEAVSAGVPLVVTDRPGLREIVDLTGGGVVVLPDDPAALADALATLRDDPDRADRLGRAAAQGAAEHFDIGETAGETLAIYESLAVD